MLTKMLTGLQWQRVFILWGHTPASVANLIGIRSLFIVEMKILKSYHVLGSMQAGLQNLCSLLHVLLYVWGTMLFIVFRNCPDIAATPCAPLKAICCCHKPPKAKFSVKYPGFVVAARIAASGTFHTKYLSVVFRGCGKFCCVFS